MPSLRDEAGIQVVAFEVPTDNAIPIAMGGVEGSHYGINGDTKLKEKILEQNKFRLNSFNLKDVDSGRECQIRRSSWLRKGLIVEVNEFGKRQVSWHRYRGDKQVVKWVACEDHSAQVGIKGMDNGLSEAHAPWLGNIKSGSGPLLPSPFIFEAGACSKHSQNKPSPGFTGLFVEDGKLESSTSGLSSIWNGVSASVFPVVLMLDSLPPRRTAMAPMVTLGSISSISALEVSGGSGSSV